MTQKTILNIAKITFFAFLLFSITSCGEDKSCDYTAGVDLIPIGCDLQANLNLTTGINNDGTFIVPGLGVIHHYCFVIPLRTP